MSADGRFVADADSLVPGQCLLCLHRWRSGDRPLCDAYPRGIPDALLTNRADHRAAFDGDGGVRFAPRPGVPARTLAALDAEFRRR